MALQYYGIFNRHQVSFEKHPAETPGIKIEPIHIDNAKDITLAEYSPRSIDCITAHRIKDYRKNSFTLLLLPKVHIIFDNILEGSEYYSKFLPD